MGAAKAAEEGSIMNVISPDPWRLIQQWQNELERLSRHAFGNDGARTEGGEWAPAVDILEETDGFVLYADIPGVDPEAIEVSMHQGLLSIRGERRLPEAGERTRYRLMERGRGAFHRQFALPHTADVTGVTATGRLGVLMIRIPKVRNAPPRRVEVRGENGD
jgi:HSP20 family protein